MDKNNSLLRDRSHHNKTTTNNNNNNINNITTNTTSSSSDFVLQWGNRKRLRCMKLQQAAAAAAAKDKEPPAVSAATPPLIGQRSITPRADHHRRVVKSPNQQQTKDSVTNAGYINLRQRSASPAHRVLRNSENTIGGGMKGQSNGGARRVCSPDRPVQDKRNGSLNKNIINNNNSNGGGSGSSETAHDAKKGGTSPGNESIPVVWPPKFAIGLTNKEKEEDFLAIKGSKLPQRPKKRAKVIQRTINLVTPGGWLCDLTLERYEVREKKITKKRPRGIKAMGSMESESE